MLVRLERAPDLDIRSENGFGPVFRGGTAQFPAAIDVGAEEADIHRKPYSPCVSTIAVQMPK